jgi:hypothetical protein
MFFHLTHTPSHACTLDMMCKSSICLFLCLIFFNLALHVVTLGGLIKLETTLVRAICHRVVDLDIWSNISFFGHQCSIQEQVPLTL